MTIKGLNKKFCFIFTENMKVILNKISAHTVRREF